jgi:hypothetical protein
LSRSPIDLAIRGLKSAIANWPLVAIRMAEGVVFMAAVVVALLVTIVPAAVAAGLDHFNFTSPEQSAQSVAGFIVEHWRLLIWTGTILLLLAVVMIFVHAFVIAGSVRVYLDGDRVAGDGNVVDRFAAYRWDTFWSAAQEGWWRVFMIYNGAWGLAGLVILLPVLVGLIIILLTKSVMAAVVIGILLALGGIFIGIPVAFVATMWATRAIVDGSRERVVAREALATARRALRAEAGMYVLMTLLVALLSIGAAAFFSSVPAGDTFSPVSLLFSLAQSFVSSLGGAWMLAAFVAAAENRAA